MAQGKTSIGSAQAEGTTGELRTEGVMGVGAVAGELERLAGCYADQVEGFELDEERSRLFEKIATPGGTSGTTFALSQRLLRTAGRRVVSVRTEDPEESIEALAARAVDLAACVDESVPAGLLGPEDGDGAAPASAGACDAGLADACEPDLPAPDAAMDATARRGLDLLLAAAGDPMEPACAVRHYAEGHAITNSRGLQRRGAAEHYQARMSYIARGATEMHDVTCRAYAPSLDELDLEALARRTALMATASLDGVELASGTYPVVFSGQVMCQMLMGFWQLFSAQKVATGQSLLAGRIGQRIASPQLTIVDEACVPGGGAKLGFDVQGAAKSRTLVVDAGVFVTPLSDLAWAGRLGLPASSGNAARRDTLGRIVPNDVTIAPSNLCVWPTEGAGLPFDELLAQVGDGIYLTDIGDIYHSFNLASGGVSAPCRGAFIRDGKLAGGIRSCSLSDNLTSLFEHVAAVGADMTFVDLEDLNAYYTGAPDVFVSEVRLVGTGA
ncbi:MAG: hypothetical protein KHY83_04685 [Coriobacteriia bacterium]|nr:hypothetical protein [Coriobacteriia bacterium]MBS5477941.1 hypothetical protein [Coriobacteriia bacterium]